MKLIRFGDPGKERPGVIINDKRYDVFDWIKDYNEEFFERDGLEQLKELVKDRANELHEVSSALRLGPPVARPSKIICIGLNYVDHAKESKAEVPKEPIIFFKSTSSIVGPNDNVVIPKSSVKTDWEVELAVIVGKKASYVEEGEALNYIAGFCLHNDYSERAFQLERGGQWVKGKSCDTFAPLGPFLATAEEVPEINNARAWLKVNDKMMQDGNTSNLIFKVPFLIHYVSQFMTLLPGDVISTGTPAGVGLGFNPPIYLKAGDVVELGIDGLGTSTQSIVAYNS